MHAEVVLTGAIKAVLRQFKKLQLRLLEWLTGPIGRGELHHFALAECRAAVKQTPRIQPARFPVLVRREF